MYKPLLLLCMQCIQVLFVYSDASERATRGLSMLRMGKRNLGFLRMGRSFELPPLTPPSYDLPGDDIEERNIIGSPRMGKHLDDYDIPRYESARAPPYPRLGVYDEYVNEIRRALSSPDDEIRQIYASIPRAGRYLGRQKRSVDDIQPVDSETGEQVDGTSEHMEKRALPRFGLRETEEIPFPRLGLVDRDIPFPRLGLYERAAFPRLGLREEDDEARSILMPRLGLRDSENEIQADERALPRFGLRDIDEEKRAMSMLRMGKREDETTEEKRAMSMLRMGKRGMSMLRMGKRGVSMLRMGRSQPTDAQTEEQKRAVSMLRMGRSLENEDATTTNTDEQEKRAMSMLRMGKRGHMSMLRMGRSYEDEANNKRAVSMLRMGRGMGMLRMGKSIPEQQQQEADQKRAMSMLRMGRGMSMLRMGKRSVAEEEETNNAEGKRNMSALRMGKKDNKEES